MGCYVCDGKARLSDARELRGLDWRGKGEVKQRSRGKGEVKQGLATAKHTGVTIGNGVVTHALL